MTDIVTETFTCEQCGRTFARAWADEDAKREYERNFPLLDPDGPKAVVCDDCYKPIADQIKRPS